ncbi:MAG: class I SAM-dependent methyltransferase [Alphaproteobacteria bacterium]|nr:class I SAM-dependent methyltransferase [Alphaproteobacteria bacterium]
MSDASYKCLYCAATDLAEIEGFSRLVRVTSDCQPFRAGGRLFVCKACGGVQKRCDASQQAETQEIYRNYKIYHQSGGVEQAVMDSASGAPLRRSQVLAEHLVRQADLPAQGHLIDIGCGNGAMLDAFGRIRADWRLWGFEIDQTHKDRLAGLPRFQKLFTGNLDAIDIDVDLLTLIHSLEHFPDPVSMLIGLRRRLRQGGRLFAEVPDASLNIFDLCVADHVAHFSQASVTRVLRRAGYVIDDISTQWVSKELSVVASLAPADHALPEPSPDPERVSIVQRQVDWLGGVVELARNVAKSQKPFGIFGTSIAATWLFSQIRESVSFFVDEDPSRSGGTYHGLAVLRPFEVPSGSDVFMAFVPAIARPIVSRLGLASVSWHVPAKIEKAS